MVGKSGVTEAVIAEAENLLTARELVKGKVLEGALLSPREVSDAICEATGAEGVTCVGSKFVIYRFSEKCQQERNQTGRAKRKAVPVSKSDPVRKGIHAVQQKKRQKSNAMPISGNRPLKKPSSATGKNSCGRKRNNPII